MAVPHHDGQRPPPSQLLHRAARLPAGVIERSLSPFHGVCEGARRSAICGSKDRLRAIVWPLATSGPVVQHGPHHSDDGEKDVVTVTPVAL
jgi:hypothetical protein